MTDLQRRALQSIKAIAFDVQGTCVDFYQPVLRAGAELNRAKGLSIAWAEFSTEWRDLYRNAMDAVIASRRPWIRVDRIYREALDVLLEWRGLAGSFTEPERDELSAVWTRLDPWPGTYKPAPAVYQLAVDFLGYPPHQIWMVACHKYDLRAARRFGMRTAFVPLAANSLALSSSLDRDRRAAVFPKCLLWIVDFAAGAPSPSSQAPRKAPSRPPSLEARKFCIGRFKTSAAIARHKSWNAFHPIRCKSSIIFEIP
ncbi:HAD-IA family hydrolase [Bradyrhizobium sp. DOA9]|uniref:HAD-IA family hydrolase n=1 Tax=Bradyrhizobium sp. DOA9 TaxID=1126627 RepID=UPI000469C1D3|nr:HAD-IA family hydrolase [Bradyrhizobium sp. DOA9]GAJ37389.1 predicted hydrolase [Bradyrhizobium sp. DOA9]